MKTPNQSFLLLGVLGVIVGFLFVSSASAEKEADPPNEESRPNLPCRQVLGDTGSKGDSEDLPEDPEAARQALIEKRTRELAEIARILYRHDQLREALTHVRAEMGLKDDKGDDSNEEGESEELGLLRTAELAGIARLWSIQERLQPHLDKARAEAGLTDEGDSDDLDESNVDPALLLDLLDERTREIAEAARHAIIRARLEGPLERARAEAGMTDEDGENGNSDKSEDEQQ